MLSSRRSLSRLNLNLSIICDLRFSLGCINSTPVGNVVCVAPEWMGCITDNFISSLSSRITVRWQAIDRDRSKTDDIVTVAFSLHKMRGGIEGEGRGRIPAQFTVVCELNKINRLPTSVRSFFQSGALYRVRHNISTRRSPCSLRD
jgi:hypothetical protein